MKRRFYPLPKQSIDILLINPPLEAEKRYGRGLSLLGSYVPPLGLGCIASYLREAGYSVSILDAEILRLSISDIITHIKSLSIKTIGLTATTVAIDNAAFVAEKIKETLNIPVILGGAHVSAAPTETFSRFDCFDYGILGEGEETTKELLDLLLRKSSKNKKNEIAGLLYKEGADLIKTGLRKHIPNIDTLPFPAYDLFPDIRKYYRPMIFDYRKLPAASVITSRGCPGRCTFCDQSVFGKTLRQHSAEYIFKLFKYLQQTFGIHDFIIHDDTFLVNKSRTMQFCKLLLDGKLNIRWYVQAKTNLVDQEILHAIKQAGCWIIAYGLESGSRDLLKNLNKGTTPEINTQALQQAKAAGLITKGFFMLGTINETADSIKATMQYIKNNAKYLDLITISKFTPFPNTPDYARALEHGFFDKTWKLSNQFSYSYIPPAVDKKTILNAANAITLSFYLRPRKLLKLFALFLNIFKEWLLVNLRLII
jgi:radical SAM superfamily enzyme YgiQ (UPF0313 family)